MPNKARDENHRPCSCLLSLLAPVNLTKVRMKSEKKNEIGDDRDGRVLKLLEAAALALEELDQLRAAGPIMPEVLDTEVARIAQEKLHPHACDLVVQRQGADLTHPLIRIRAGEVGSIR